MEHYNPTDCYNSEQGVRAYDNLEPNNRVWMSKLKSMFVAENGKLRE